MYEHTRMEHTLLVDLYRADTPLVCVSVGGRSPLFSFYLTTTGYLIPSNHGIYNHSM